MTGAAHGIGDAIASMFAEHGACVAVVDRDLDAASQVAARIGGVAVECDVADPVAVDRAMDACAERLGGIDVLVNNAGIFASTSLLDITAESWDEMFAVNTRSMLLTTQKAARRMIAQRSGGSIVNMASMGGKSGAPGQAHYAASKAAVISLTQVAAAELGAYDITVNCICPGYVLTDMGAATRTTEMVEEWSRLSPLGRLGEPSDVASMALFLASPDAAYCTGQAMNVTGGMITH